MTNLYPKPNLLLSALKNCISFSVFILLSAGLLAQPVIHSFSPASGYIGTTVTINGSNFSPVASGNIVYLGAVRATILSATASAITITVPSGATYQPISVTTNHLTAYSSQPFMVKAPAPYPGFLTTSFSSRKDFATGKYPNFITSADLDGDGKSDLVTLNNDSSTVSLFLNTGGSGSLSFAPAIDYDAGTHPFGAALGDVNGDGKPDVVIGNYDSSRITVYINEGTPGTLSFSKKEFASGLNPISIGIIDFDLDGKPDIAAVNNNGYTVSVLKNISNPDSLIFAPKVDYAVGTWPRSLTISDFNGDGKPDLAVVNHDDNTFSVLKNTSSAGTISFASKIDFATGGSPFYINAADLDGDGKPDIIATNSTSGTISVYKNNSAAGAIAFASKVDFATGTTPTSSTSGDLDGDGKPDIAVVNFGANSLSLFRNTSDSTAISFEPKRDYATGLSPRVACIGDFNGDGQPDLSFMNSNSNTFSVLTNTMRAVPLIQSFSPASGSTDSIITIIGTGFMTTTSVSIGGVPVKSFTITSSTMLRATIESGATGDVVVTTPEGSAVMPGFTFVTPAPAIKSLMPESGAIGTTVMIKGKNFRYISSDPVVYFGAVRATILNFTDTLITVTVPTGATYKPVTVTANSLTAYSAKPFRVIFPGMATGLKSSSFAAKKVFLAGGNPRSIAIADFDSDGKADLFVTNQSTATASIFRNTSTFKNISLGTKQDLLMEADPFGVAAGDFDGDGKTDIAVSNSNTGNAGSVSVRRNTSTAGSISFSENNTMSVGNGPLGLSAADLNADGKPDLVVTAGNSGIIALFKNTSDSAGHISFAPQINISALQHSENIVTADLDGDGKPEMITADFSGSSMSVWRNTSSGGTISFAAPTSYAAGTNPAGISAGDFDNDGKTDIAVINYSSNTVSVFKNTSSTGNISFTDKVDYATGEFPRAISLADLDGDGKTDIIIPCNTPSAVSVLRNTSFPGVLSFANRIEYATGVQPPGVSIADLDGDSKPEIIVANDYNSISILHNRVDEPIITSFTPAAAETDTTITIRGENFSETTAVSFGGIPASSFVITSDTVITAKVSTGSTGVVQVKTPWGVDTLGSFTYIPPAPIIKSFFPASATVGTEIRIVGDHFGKVTSISFGGMQASSFTINSDTLITAVVGMGASGNIIVSTQYRSDTLGHLTFVPPLPMITSFTPTAGNAGTLVTIKGQNFSWTTNVSFGNINAASYIVKSDSIITAMPGDGGTGVIRVTSDFGTDTLGIFIFLQPDALMTYPNPAVGFALLAHPATDSPSQLQLVDMNGIVVKTIAVPPKEAQTKIDLTKVQPGIYRVIWSDGQTSLNQALIVQ
jgi:FG-GAP-like repeat/IPT/TIG domain/Secretion system C-terminal sorting domain/FG-GAP repeat